MGIFKDLFSFCSFIAFAHFANGGFLSELKLPNIYYKMPPGSGEPVNIPIEQVVKPCSNNITVLVVHGWTASPDHVSIVPIINALMATGEFNVLVADWYVPAHLDYVSSRYQIGPMGELFGQKLFEYSKKHNIAPSNIMIAGHSLGAHIAGNVGKYFNGTISRIFGMDPAEPLIATGSEDCLQKTDAEQVVVIHTTSSLGKRDPIGTIDFYVHWGVMSQNGCFDTSKAVELLTNFNVCSHNRAVDLTAEAFLVKLNFPAYYCSIKAITKQAADMCLQNQPNVTKESIEQDIATKNDQGNIVYFNRFIPKSATGTYIFDTYGIAPYGMGVNSRVAKNYS